MNIFDKSQEVEVTEEVKQENDTQNYLQLLTGGSIKVEQKGVIAFKDYDIIKEEITNIANKYKGLVFDNMSESEYKKCKSDLADLRKSLKLVDAERLKISKEFKAPLVIFEKDLTKPLLDIFKDAITDLDKNVKVYDQKQKDAKKLDITEYYLMMLKEYPEFNSISLDSIFNTKWYNVAYTQKKINAELLNFYSKKNEQLDIIKLMPNGGDIKVEWFDNGFDLALAQETVLRRIKSAKEEQAKIDKVNGDRGIEVSPFNGEWPKQNSDRAVEVNLTDNLKKYIDENVLTYVGDETFEPVIETDVNGVKRIDFDKVVIEEEAIAVFGVKGSMSTLMKLKEFIGKLITEEQLEKTNIKKVSDYTDFMEENK